MTKRLVCNEAKRHSLFIGGMDRHRPGAAGMEKKATLANVNSRGESMRMVAKRLSPETPIGDISDEALEFVRGGFACDNYIGACQKAEELLMSLVDA